MNNTIITLKDAGFKRNSFKTNLLILFFTIALVTLGSIPTLANAPGGDKIALKLIPFNLKDDRFYVKEIIDGREDKTKLGSVKSWLNREAPVTLTGDLRTSLQALFDVSFPEGKSKIPIVIKINIFKIRETGKLDSYFSAEAKLAFYQEKDGQLGKVFETESYVEKKCWPNHEENIREVLEQCMNNFTAASWETITPDWEEYNKVAGQSTANDHQMTITMPERYEVYLLESSINEPYCGGSFNHYEYDNNQAGWINIVHHSYTFYTFNQGADNGKIYMTNDTNGFMRRLGDSGFAVIFEGGIPCGLAYQSGERKFFYGLNAQESLVYFPTGKKGIAATLAWYQRKLFLSDQSDWNNGISFSLGFQW